MPSPTGEATAILRVYESPELLTKDVSNVSEDDLYAGDLWAFSVIIHELLTKSLPYDARFQIDQVSQINLSSPLWHRSYCISEECRDFVTRALSIEPANRMSIYQALNHPWLLKELACVRHTANTELKVTRVFETMRDFNPRHEL